ncbi:hypothetical protein PT008_08105 [Proteus mirabilis]|uniref:hypothetical protein n=1 Tax=Proteus terrae TaxID=1574161 RepID=UPI00240D96DB|nr:hypothetical protein [Proteus mirabilis]WFC30143.1 hypothetical protein PT008_08105 [Proteus mirabilis]
MNKKYIEVAKLLHTIFQQYHERMDLPFFCTYPLNCCQGASILLGQLILDLHPNAEITIVKGSSRKDDNHHYWLEVDKKIFDLTVEQFVSWMNKKYHCPASPIYGDKKHPLAGYFFYKQLFSFDEAYQVFITKHANEEDVVEAYGVVLLKYFELVQ